MKRTLIKNQPPGTFVESEDNDIVVPAGSDGSEAWLTDQDIADMKLDKLKKPKGNVINYDDAVKAFEDKIEWSDESMEGCECIPCFKGEDDE